MNLSNSSSLLYKNETDIRHELEREQAKNIPIFEESDKMPSGCRLILYMFSIVDYATKSQILRFTGLPPNTRSVSWLYKHAYIDAGRLTGRSKYFFWIDNKGLEILKSMNVTASVPVLKLNILQHSIGVTEALVNESAYGYTAVSREFVIDGIRVDIYIERGRDVYFIEYDRGTESFNQLSAKFKQYGSSQYVALNRSHLHIYYSGDKEQRLDVIKNALKSADLTNFVSVKIGYIDMEKVLFNKSVRKAMKLVSAST